MDVCLEVAKIRYQSENKVTLKARWWVLGYTGNPYPVSREFRTINLTRSNYGNFVDISDKINKIRTNPGMPC